MNNKKRIEILEREVWGLKNPPKFKVRDKVKWLEKIYEEFEDKWFNYTGLIISHEVKGNSKFEFRNKYDILIDGGDFIEKGISEYCLEKIKK